jgi:hypothetical protein
MKAAFSECCLHQPGLDATNLLVTTRSSRRLLLEMNRSEVIRLNPDSMGRRSWFWDFLRLAVTMEGQTDAPDALHRSRQFHAITRVP